MVLQYDVLYERDSSLATVAGNYDDGSGSVLNISGDGTVFEQDPSSGCVISGLVSIIDAAYNMYDIALEFSNCVGEFAFVNGSSFTGMAALDNTSTPEGLIIAVTGDVSGDTASLIFIEERL